MRLLQQVRHAAPAPVDAQRLPAKTRSRELLEGFVAFAVSHRGLSQSTVGGYTHCIDRFLKHTGIDSQETLRLLSVVQIDRFLWEASRGRARSTVYVMCSAVRAFLRYAHVRGLLGEDLGAHVPTPHIYAMERLPRFLAWADVERTLASPDRTTLIGCRDYGILVLLALCGLRSGEVAALALADVDWRHDAIHLRRPKSNSTEHIPLVPAVGEALMRYVRRRPPAPFSELFLKVLAPIGPVTRASIGQVVKVHLRRAGVKAPHWGGHTLRHSHAAELLRRGFSLKTIGDVLGHHHPDSTFIYAKTAVDELRELCLDVEAVLP
jgi:integrase/recombinase XerD